MFNFLKLKPSARKAYAPEGNAIPPGGIEPDAEIEQKGAF